MIKVLVGEEEDLDDVSLSMRLQNVSEWECRSTSCPGDITQWIKI
jgi:hypothetical protein